jgi:hypothetical protein
MKTVVYVIVQSVIAGGKEYKNIHGVYTFKHQAQDRMNEIVVEFEDKQDAEGNFLWECESPWWSIANFKSNTHDFSMRIEVVEREIEL